MASSGFEEIFNHSGNLVKVKGYFGYGKEVCLTAFAGGVYIHISDKSKCFVEGKFDLTKSKSVSMKLEDCIKMVELIQSADCYFQQLKESAVELAHPQPQSQSQQQHQQQHPQPQQQQQQQKTQRYQQPEPLLQQPGPSYQWQPVAIQALDSSPRNMWEDYQKYFT